VSIAAIGVQVQLLLDDDAEQSIVDENSHAAEDGAVGDLTEKSQLLGDVTDKARLGPHFEQLTRLRWFPAARIGVNRGSWRRAFRHRGWMERLLRMDRSA